MAPQSHANELIGRQKTGGKKPHPIIRVRLFCGLIGAISAISAIGNWLNCQADMIFDSEEEGRGAVKEKNSLARFFMFLPVFM